MKPLDEYKLCLEKGSFHPDDEIQDDLNDDYDKIEAGESLGLEASIVSP
jgi:hypothetical protein